jgi:malonyl CoA-acyl carrier protein transacylase
MYDTGLVFPGQGSQRRGMGIDFRDKYPEAQRVFQKASDVLNVDVEQICRDEDPRLDLTEFTQPCILTAQIAMYESLKVQYGFRAQVFGGHSLGEYTALVAAQAIPFEVAVELVRFRGKLMQLGVELGQGSMAAVIMDGLPHREVKAIADECKVDIANDNSTSQVVLSGESSRIEMASQILRNRYEAFSVRVVPLTVSAPFHSRHMAEIEEQFKTMLISKSDSFDSQRARFVTSNFTGDFHTGNLDDLINSLTRQISGQVRWRDNMEALNGHARVIYELGPNRPLSGFFKTLGVTVKSILDVRTAQRAFQQIEAGIFTVSGASL